MDSCRAVMVPICVMCWCMMFCSKATWVTYDNVSRLEDDLFTRYRRTIRPLRNQSEAIIIWFKLYFDVIQQLDLRTQILISDGFLSLKWTDELLTWEPAEYGGVEKLYVEQNRLWLPNLVMYNAVSEAGKIIGSDNNHLVKIDSSGKVSWDPGFNLETTCKADITLFPFDTQTCEIQVISWMLENDELRLQSIQKPSDFMKFTQLMGEFMAEGSYVRKLGYLKKDTVACGLSLKRRVRFYAFSLIAPLVMLSLLSVVSFVVPAESGEKLTVSMTTLLSFTVYLGVLDSIMPKTSDNVSILLVCVTILMGISLLSVVGNVTILYLYHRQDDKRGNSLNQDTDKHLQDLKANPSEEGEIIYSLNKLNPDRFPDSQRSMTPDKMTNNLATSRCLNKAFLVMFSVLLLFTVICVALLYKYY